ncbi:MAG: Asp23/Gls24 family envelope stress response protein [Terrisporobacter sp.]|uniref:Asp23/Gls24 family envelope stress response protein n=1 Tax=Terrisporobacter sp. TaxID=1965305 RepID=UPI002FCAF900
MENNNNLGQVKISNDVIVTIAGLAALEVEGVETITSLTDKLLKNNGVKIQIEDDKVTLDVAITVEYGMSIPDVSMKVQENVKNTVETMTGLEVSQVNIQVQEISFKKEKQELELAKQAKKEEAKLAKQAKKEETKKTSN